MGVGERPGRGAGNLALQDRRGTAPDRLRRVVRSLTIEPRVTCVIKAIGYAANHSFSRLKPLAFEREEAGPGEVEIEVLFTGVCHSDIHQVKNEWSNTVYPCMPGHEVVGRVTRTGADVSRHKIGDLVGVGCMIDSCGACEPCRSHEEQYCEGPNSWLATYNGPMVPAAKAEDGGNMYGRDNTYGGYSNVLVVREEFVLKIPEALAPEAAAPILCAGVTTYSPMRHWGVKAGDKVGVIGLGGLGHMAVKLARAMGAEVTAFTRTKEKLDEAAALGATGVLESDKDALKALKNSFDFMMSTVPEKHDLNPFVELLKRDGTVCVVGALEPLAPENNMERAMHRKSVAGSLIGSLAETQEVLDFCAENGIAPDIELIPIQDINKAYKKVESGDVRFRYVIDMASLKAELEDA
jgi:alcohol dehydrogenase (NADP+)